MAPTTRVQFSPVTPDEGGSVSGKPPVFEAGFGRSIRSPPATGRWRNLAAHRALNAEVPGSRPGRPASFSRVSFKGKDRTLRTFRLGFDSSYPYQVLRPVVQFAQDAALRTLKLGLESPLVDHARCRPTGEALDCRSRRCGFDSRTPRQVFLWGCRPAAGSLVLTQKTRVQFSPALPRGCRLIGQDRCLSSSGCGIATRRPYQFSGYKLWRRSTRFLIDRARFESVMAHQDVPR